MRNSFNGLFAATGCIVLKIKRSTADWSTSQSIMLGWDPDKSIICGEIWSQKSTSEVNCK